MEWVETTGRDVEEAKEAALDILGVDDSEVEFEIVEEGRPSFLGFGRRPARIRARLRPRFPAPKRDRRQRRTGKDHQGAGDRELRTRAGNRNTGVEAKEPAVNEQVEARAESEGEAVAIPSRVELANIAQTFLAGVMHEFGVAGEVKVGSLDDTSMDLEVEGENLGVLVGSRGSVLMALQEITKSVVQASAGEAAGRVGVDISGYKLRRKEALSRFTVEQANMVLADGREVAFEVMAAPDRKIVHDVVAEIAGVGSRSEGEEPHRYVVLYPSSESTASEADVSGEAAPIDS